ncbi:Uncharacterized protein OBRU01_21962 [Operophtera brumata]|uniref:Uncharacterized protein n=1 Tax=Operophtera brumata TaxID=104452 RepID=A0A0L7KSH0_OPEBR|nr:Uncharacterized protein OBRU01_21962 [Operophtera brumata]
MANGFVGSTINFPFSFDTDFEEEEEPGRITPHLSQRLNREEVYKDSSFLFHYYDLSVETLY